MAAEKEWHLTPEELSARLPGRPSLKTLANWRARGDGPEFIRIGRAVRYPLSKVEKWEDEKAGPR